MNLKYYLRGLGVGIVVTSLILGIGLGSRKETLSNEEIKERARALGMVEESITVAEAAAQQEEEAQEADAIDDPQPGEDTLGEADAEPVVSEEPDRSVSSEAISEPTADVSASPEASAEPTVSASASPEASVEPTVSASASPKASTEPTPSTSPEASATPKTGSETAADSKEIVDITINPGEGSYAISRKLEQSGLIDDASEYDAYLCDNGYHTKLRAGVHKIPMGSTREEIAKLLCQ